MWGLLHGVAALCAGYLLIGSVCVAADDVSAQSAMLPAVLADYEAARLLSTIEQQISNGRIISPPDDNAMETWQRVLQRGIAAQNSPAIVRALADFEKHARMRAANESAEGRVLVAAELTVFADQAGRMVGRAAPGMASAPSEASAIRDAPLAQSGSLPQPSGLGAATGAGLAREVPQSPPPGAAAPGFDVATRDAARAVSTAIMVPAPATANRDGPQAASTGGGTPAAVGPASRDVAQGASAAVAAVVPVTREALQTQSTGIGGALTGLATPDAPIAKPSGNAASPADTATRDAPPVKSPAEAATRDAAPARLAAITVPPAAPATHDAVQNDRPATPPQTATQAPAVRDPRGADSAALPEQKPAHDPAGPSASPGPSAIPTQANLETAKPGPAAGAPATPPAPRQPAAQDLALAVFYTARGDEMLARKDISAARKFYEYAANAGSARAATTLAKTYDAAFIDQLGVVGLLPDAALAARWYRRAEELEGPHAGSRLLTQSAETIK